MAFLRSLFAGVSGLQNNQLMMDVIGNNIANVNTIGFKSGRVTFSELYAQTLKSATQPVLSTGGTNPIQVGVGTTVNTLDTIFSQGNIQTTGQTTDMAISGPAFFVVNKGGRTAYTRVGTFQLDSTGKLVNPGDGEILQGKLADAVGNIPSGTALQDIQIGLDMQSPSRATTTVSFAGNLDASGAVPSAGPPPVAGATASASVTVFDSLGNKQTVTLNFAKTAPNTWNWTASVPAPAVVTAGAGTITFNTDGTLQSFTGNPLAINPNDGASPMSITLDAGTPSPAAPGIFSGITQTSGASTLTPRSQDGYGAGSLSNISIDSTGRILGTFSNGTVMTLAQVMLAQFANPGGLMRIGENCYDISGNSGTPEIVTPGDTSKIQSGALEQSNVDLANEFTNMITAQRGFQANARVITTSDQFLQEVVDLKR